MNTENSPALNMLGLVALLIFVVLAWDHIAAVFRVFGAILG